MNKNTLVALTALEETWGGDSEGIVFLGEWCKKWSRRHVWQKRNSITLPYLWNNAEQIEQAIEYTNFISNHLLDILISWLNDFHNTNYDKKFWNIILGDWIISYIHIMYDRYLNIKTLIEKYESFDCYSLDVNHHIISKDSTDFQSKSGNSDVFNLQIFSDILLHFNISCKKIHIKQNQITQLLYNHDRGLLRQLFDKIKRNMGSEVIFCQVYQEEKPITWLWKLFQYKGVISNDDMLYPISLSIPIINHTLRKQTLCTDNNDDDFTQFAKRNLLKYLPLLYLEGFLPFQHEVEKLPIKRVAKIVSANAAYSNYIYKFHLAKNHKTVTSYYVQHGGCYGLDKNNVSEKYEKSISHQYWTWGWKKNKEIPLVSQKGWNQDRFFKKRENILLVTDDMMPYLYRLQYFFNSSQIRDNYLPSILDFLKQIYYREEIILRPHHFRSEWGIVEQIKQSFKEITISKLNKNFKTELYNSKICIVPHLITTQWEALMLNHPTIIFVDPLFLNFNSQFFNMFTMMEKSKILHFNPQSAANHLNQVYHDISGWWKSDQVQKTLLEIKNTYCKGGKSWLNHWIKKVQK